MLSKITNRIFPSEANALRPRLACEITSAGVVAARPGEADQEIVSGFAAQPGVPNPLAGHPYVLLRDSYADTLAKAGITVPGGMSPFKYVGTACGTRSPDCQKAVEAIKASAASAYAPMRMGVEPFLACRPEITTS